MRRTISRARGASTLLARSARWLRRAGPGSTGRPDVVAVQCPHAGRGSLASGPPDCCGRAAPSSPQRAGSERCDHARPRTAASQLALASRLALPSVGLNGSGDGPGAPAVRRRHRPGRLVAGDAPVPALELQDVEAVVVQQDDVDTRRLGRRGARQDVGPGVRGGGVGQQAGVARRARRLRAPGQARPSRATARP